MQKTKYLIVGIIVGLLGIAWGASAAPTYRIDRTILPEASSTYDLGSSTRPWRVLYVDSCVGCGTGGGSATTTINTVNGPAFIFTPGNGLTISSSSNQFTWTNIGVTSWNGATGTVTFNPYAAGFVTATTTDLVSLLNVSTTNATTSFLRFTTATGTNIWGTAASGLTLQIPNAGSASGITLIAASSTSGNNNGGSVGLYAGVAAGDGNGGDVILSPGRWNGTGGGNKGQVLFPDDQDWGEIDLKVQDTSVVNGFGIDLNFYGAGGNGTGPGGGLNFVGGTGGATGSGGTLSFGGGAGGATSGNGGGFSVEGGTSRGTSTAGSVSFTGGSAAGTGLGGDVVFRPGISSAGVASSGKIRFRDGANNIGAVLNMSSITTADKTFTFPNATGTFALTTDLYTPGFVTATTTQFLSLVHVSTTNATTTNLRFGNATGTAVHFGDSTKISTAKEVIGATFQYATTTQTANNQPLKKAYTITNFYCNTNGATVTLWADERSSSTPNSAGSAIFSGTGAACDNDGLNVTSFADSALAANALLNVFASSTPNSTTTVNFTFTVKEQ